MRYLWYSMYTFVTALAVYALFFRPPAHHPADPIPDPVATETVAGSEDADVQIALILDTSSSMDGLVEQARTQLWEMVAEMQLDDEDREQVVEVALYQYGNSRLDKRDGFIEQLTPLTRDLDHVTVKLHSLRTSGGQEYAPMAIFRAVEELDWNHDDSVKRFIVIAGNEQFNQGPVGNGDALMAAQRSQIQVMPIYCANEGASRVAVLSWREAARLAGMEFDSIDPDQTVAGIESPFDDDILEKYRQLQETRVYLPGGESRYANEAEGYVDGKVAVDRAVVQSRQTGSKDVVSAYGKGSFDLDEVPAAQLPAPLRGKSKAEQRDYLAKRNTRQEALQQEISELNKKRKQHIQKRMKEIPSYRPSNLGESFRRNALKTY